MTPYSELNDVFNIDPDVEETVTTDTPTVPVSTAEILPAVVDDTKDDVTTDYEKARTTIQSVLTTSEQAIKDLSLVAKSSESARAYEVLGQLIKVTAETAQNLLDVQEKTKKIRKDDKKQQPIGTQNNIVFAGSTQELLKALRAKKLEAEDHE
mgnify:FL=1